MASQSQTIAQIQQAEIDAKNIVEKAQTEGNKSISEANDKSVSIISTVEEAAKKSSEELLNKAKDNAKIEYKKIMVDGDNERRSIIDGSRKNLPNAEKHIKDILNSMFK